MPFLRPESYSKFIAKLYRKFYRVMFNGEAKEPCNSAIDLICYKIDEDNRTVLARCQPFSRNNIILLEMCHLYLALQDYKKQHPAEKVTATFWSAIDSEEAKIIAKALGISFRYRRIFPINTQK